MTQQTEETIRTLFETTISGGLEPFNAWLNNNENKDEELSDYHKEDKNVLDAIKKHYKQLTSEEDKKSYQEIIRPFFKTIIMGQAIAALLGELKSPNEQIKPEKIKKLKVAIHIQKEQLKEFERLINTNTWNEEQLKFIRNAVIVVTIVILSSIGILSAGLIPGIALAVFVKSTIGVAALIGIPFIAGAIAGFAAYQDIQKEQKRREDRVLRLFCSPTEKAQAKTSNQHPHAREAFSPLLDGMKQGLKMAKEELKKIKKKRSTPW